MITLGDSSGSVKLACQENCGDEMCNNEARASGEGSGTQNYNQSLSGSQGKVGEWICDMYKIFTRTHILI